MKRSSLLITVIVVVLLLIGAGFFLLQKLSAEVSFSGSVETVQPAIPQIEVPEIDLVQHWTVYDWPIGSPHVVLFSLDDDSQYKFMQVFFQDHRFECVAFRTWEEYLASLPTFDQIHTDPQTCLLSKAIKFRIIPGGKAYVYLRIQHPRYVHLP